nr:hypothetical protein B0A51_10647 [Rachicladosporium sp. CCFEE 5018]
MAALSEGQIRLLSFQESSSNDAIRLDIRTYDRTQAPSYTALSYEWGSATSPGFIEVGGVPRSVRRNLYDALVHLPGHISAPFWVDALCIDQENAQERNHQVRAMGEIYSGATLVVAWLGLMDDDVRPCFVATGRESLEAVRAARKALVRREYWTRLWVYQELILAKEITIACGAHSIEYSDLETLLWNVDGDYEAHRICYAVSRGPIYNLCEALVQFSTCQCADERDRIFAVLSVVNRDEREDLLRILPIYSSPKARLVETALEHINDLQSRTFVSGELIKRALAVLAGMQDAPLGKTDAFQSGHCKKLCSMLRRYEQSTETTLRSLLLTILKGRRRGKIVQGHLVDPAFDPKYAPLLSPHHWDAFLAKQIGSEGSYLNGLKPLHHHHHDPEVGGHDTAGRFAVVPQSLAVVDDSGAKYWLYARDMNPRKALALCSRNISLVPYRAPYILPWVRNPWPRLQKRFEDNYTRYSAKQVASEISRLRVTIPRSWARDLGLERGVSSDG